MRKMKYVILISVVQIIYLLGCASEEVKKEPPRAVEKQLSCTFNQLDGECRVLKTFLIDKQKGEPYLICSMGTCSDGDCENGKGTLSYPGVCKIELNFKKVKLNGMGSFDLWVCFF